MKGITNEEQLNGIGKDKIVIADFFAEWCNPCKMLMSSIEELAKTYAGNTQVEVIKINVEKSPELTEEYSVMSVPTILFLQNGKIIDFLPGLISKESIVSKIEALLAE